MDEKDPATTAEAESRFLVLIPVYNDWESLNLVLTHLDDALYKESREAEVLVVDDASNEPIGSSTFGPYRALTRIQGLRLRRNLGHQRAISIGLAYAYDHLRCRAVVIMDADGEDDPRDVPRLLARCEEEEFAKIVFAMRERRSEGPLFRVFYFLYKALHRFLTGRRVEIGNFSVVPGPILPRLIVISEIWNHYAAAVIKSRLPSAMLPTHRAKRLAGESRMNFVALVMHGLSAMSVFADIIGVRLLLLSSLMVILTLLALGGILVVQLGTDLYVPDWGIYTVGLLILIAFQALTTVIAFTLTRLSGREEMSFIPTRDYSWFCWGLEQVYPAA